MKPSGILTTEKITEKSQKNLEKKKTKKNTFSNIIFISIPHYPTDILARDYRFKSYKNTK